MGTNNVIFMEIIEWFDDPGKELVHRIPEKGSGDIKWGAQLTVRESQCAVFFYNGKAYGAFGAGRPHLTTANIPLLTDIPCLGHDQPAARRSLFCQYERSSPI